MRKIVFMGKAFIKKNKRGVQRYTCEIIRNLDKYVENSDVEVLIPNVNVELPVLKNIKFVRFGGTCIKGWQYWAYQYYLLKNNALGISLSADGPSVIKSGISAIHDVAVLNEKIYFKTIKNKIKYFKKYIKHKYILFLYKIISKRAKCIITVSDFSKKEIAKYYNYDINKIVVIYNGWEHLKRIRIDKDRIKYKKIKSKSFYFFLGGQDKYKNIKWIYEIAKKNKNDLFIMAGPPKDAKNLSDDSINIENINNIKYLGYISDEEIAFFMKNCKAFLFPSLYEGFGIPPLEALYFGAKVICARSSCLPEIYEDCVIYVDPYNYNIDLNELLKKKVAPPDKLFNKYSWDKSAAILWELIKKYR